MRVRPKAFMLQRSYNHNHVQAVTLEVVCTTGTVDSSSRAVQFKKNIYILSYQPKVRMFHVSEQARHANVLLQVEEYTGGSAALIPCQPLRVGHLYVAKPNRQKNGGIVAVSG